MELRWKNTKPRAVCWGLLIVFAVSILLWGIGHSMSEHATENVFDAYYRALLFREGKLPRNLGGPEWSEQWINREHGVQWYDIKWREELPEGVSSISVMADQKQKTVKFIQEKGAYWYRYVYDTVEKTLTYSTNDRRTTVREDFLFTILLPDWLAANPDGAFSAENLGSWSGEQASVPTSGDKKPSGMQDSGRRMQGFDVYDC